MKLLVWMLCAALSGCVLSPETRIEESAYAAAMALDADQTNQIRSTPGHWESGSDWAMGKHPSQASVIEFMAAQEAAHVAAAVVLTDLHAPHWALRTFEATTLFEEGQNVVHNYEVGISVNF